MPGEIKSNLFVNIWKLEKDDARYVELEILIRNSPEATIQILNDILEEKKQYLIIRHDKEETGYSGYICSECGYNWG